MSDLEPRRSRTPRRAREQRAYNLAMAGGAAGLVFVVTAVLALATSFSWTPAIIALVIAVVCVVMFRRAVGR
jgi:lysylphosphatidylglycerol synthetase-like protein (DUF2156 family)